MTHPVETAMAELAAEGLVTISGHICCPGRVVGGSGSAVAEGKPE